MSLGILQSGPGAAINDGVLGSAMASGPGSAYQSGVLGEYFEGPTAGLGCACRGCGGLGADEGISVPASLLLGLGIGAGMMYLLGPGGKKLGLTPNRRRRRRR